MIASCVSLELGEHVGGLIIIAIVLFSMLLNFLMEFQARHAVEEIQKQIVITAAVVRDGKEQQLPVAELVPGDIVRLKAGDLMPRCHSRVRQSFRHQRDKLASLLPKLASNRSSFAFSHSTNALVRIRGSVQRWNWAALIL